MNHEQATYILLDALEEMALKLSSTVSEVRTLLGQATQVKTSEEPTPTPTPTESRLTKLIRYDKKHRPSRARSPYTHPVTDDDAFPQCYEGEADLPDHESALVGIGYDDRGRTIFSESHRAIEWEEGKSFEDLLAHLHLDDPVRIVVFGEVSGKLSQGGISRLMGMTRDLPIIFCGFDKNSKITDFEIAGFLSNVAFDGLTLKDHKVGEAENVLYENTLFEGAFEVAGQSKSIDIRFCEFAHESVAHLTNVNGARIEFCRFHEPGQLHIRGTNLGFGYFAGPEQDIPA